MKWTRGPNTFETAPRLVLASEYVPKQSKKRKRKTDPAASNSSSSSSSVVAEPKRARKTPAAPAESGSESGSESDESDAAHDSDQSDEERGDARDRFTGLVHQDTCGRCGQGGTLYECDYCDCAYHTECTGLSEEPPDEYECFRCMAEAKR